MDFSFAHIADGTYLTALLRVSRPYTCHYEISRLKIIDDNPAVQKGAGANGAGLLIHWNAEHGDDLMASASEPR